MEKKCDPCDGASVHFSSVIIDSALSANHPLTYPPAIYTNTFSITSPGILFSPWSYHRPQLSYHVFNKKHAWGKRTCTKLIVVVVHLRSSTVQ